MSLVIIYFVLMTGFVFSFCMSANRIISMLMLLEGMMLTNLCLALYFGLMSTIQVEHFMVLITFSVIEAALGLTLLVCTIRTSGSDMLKSSWTQ